MSFVERLRRLSSGGASSPKAGDPTSPTRNNVWSSTFDPGSNANMKQVGASYYDKPTDSKSGSIWEMHLESQEKSKAAEPASASAGGSNTLSADELRQMFTQDKVEAALKRADPSGSGKVDYSQFMSMLRQK